MSTNLITGYAGKSHITSAGDGVVNAAVLGTGRYVLDVAERFAYELISNNQIRIKSGYAIDQGRKIELAVNDYEELIIDNGLQGVKRCDLVAITYEKNLETGIETATMNIIKGTSGDDYNDPEYTSGDIIAGDIKDDFLLYRLKLNGISVEAVEPLFKVRKSVVEMDTSKNTTAFTAASARENLKSGESHATLFGKIEKWFSDLKEVAFTGKIPWSDVTGKPSTYAPSSHTHDDRYYTENEVDNIADGVKGSAFTYTNNGIENLKRLITRSYTDADTNILNTCNGSIKEVRDAVGGCLPISGGTLMGSLDIASGKYIHGIHTNGTILDILGLNKNNNCHVGNDTTPTFLHGAGYQLDISGAFICPNVSNQMSCGTKNKLWTTVFSKTGAINTSDRTKKHNIIDLTEAYEQLFLKLKPKSFIFNDGDRVHIGAISQDVEDAMQELGIEPRQFAGFCKDIRYEYTEYNEEDGTPVESSKVPCKDEDGNIIYDYALRYQEFIFLTVHMVQKLWNRVEILEKENAEMRDQIKAMQQDIAELKKIRA
jgi:hypothetical protein